MKHLAPVPFRDFVCAAGACPDSCCRAGWEIVIDPDTLARYASLPGPDGDRVRAAVLPGAEPVLRQDAARVCLLLDPDGLCHAQKRFGHDCLCRVCREYPRFHREFGNLTEHGVSLSCPTAFALAVSRPPELVEWTDDSPIVLNDLDPERYLPLREGRALALRLLAEEDRPLWERLALVWELAKRLQKGLDGGRRAGKTACRRLGNPIGQKAVLRALRRRNCRDKLPFSASPRNRAPGCPYKNAAQLAERFAGLEILSPEWREGLQALIDCLGEAGAHRAPLRKDRVREAGAHCAPLRKDRVRKASAHGAPPGAGSGSEAELYARYLWYSLFKYWLDAADDGQLLPRVRRSFAMTELGCAMDRLVPQAESWLRRISREIEHCEENLEALLHDC